MTQTTEKASTLGGTEKLRTAGSISNSKEILRDFETLASLKPSDFNPVGHIDYAVSTAERCPDGIAMRVLQSSAYQTVVRNLKPGADPSPFRRLCPLCQQSSLATATPNLEVILRLGGIWLKCWGGCSTPDVLESITKPHGLRAKHPLSATDTHDPYLALTQNECGRIPGQQTEQLLRAALDQAEKRANGCYLCGLDFITEDGWVFELPTQGRPKFAVHESCVLNPLPTDSKYIGEYDGSSWNELAP